MTFGLIEIKTGGRISVDTSTERGTFQFDLEFAGVYDKSKVEEVNQLLKKIKVEDMIDLFNRVNKVGKYKVD